MSQPLPPDEPPDDQPLPDAEVEPSDPDPRDEPGHQRCWRCGKFVFAVDGRCPICEAVLQPSAGTPARRRRNATRTSGKLVVEQDLHAIKVVLWMFVVLLGVSVVQAWYLHARLQWQGMPGPQQRQVLIEQFVIFSAIDSVLTLLGLAWAGRPPGVHAGVDRKLVTWFAAVPLLAAMLGVNFLYHHFLLDFIGAVDANGVLALSFRDAPALMILLVCVQPAVVEELFFRYLALGHLRRVMGDHGAIWVSAMMFGVAHIHVPLSVPVLALLGVGLGYARLLSGGMALPMLLHAAHNLVVLLVEANR